jgi:hypothetical protein
MKRSTAIDILKRTLTKYNNNTPWYSERKHAEEILDVLDQIGLLKPTHKVSVTKRDIEFMPYEETVIVEGWEKE